MRIRTVFFEFFVKFARPNQVCQARTSMAARNRKQTVHYDPQFHGAADCDVRIASGSGSPTTANHSQPAMATATEKLSRNDNFPSGPRGCKWEGCSETRSTPNTLSCHQSKCRFKQGGQTHTPLTLPALTFHLIGATSSVTPATHRRQQDSISSTDAGMVLRFEPIAEGPEDFM